LNSLSLYGNDAGNEGTYTIQELAINVVASTWIDVLYDNDNITV